MTFSTRRSPSVFRSKRIASYSGLPIFFNAIALFTGGGLIATSTKVKQGCWLLVLASMYLKHMHVPSLLHTLYKYYVVASPCHVRLADLTAEAWKKRSMVDSKL